MSLRVRVLAAPLTRLRVLGRQTYSGCQNAVFEPHVLSLERQLAVDAATLGLRIIVR